MAEFAGVVSSEVPSAPSGRGAGRGTLAEPRPEQRSSRHLDVIEAALGCLATRGLAKTALDDVARCAGLSRATVYRVFPGGREAILAAVVDTERVRLCTQVDLAAAAADDVKGALVAGILEAARGLSGHRALAYLVEHEPDVVLPFLCFDHMDRILSVASRFAAALLTRWLEEDHALRAAEWVARITFSYLAQPRGIDLSERNDVARFVLPGVLAACAGYGGAGQTTLCHGEVPSGLEEGSKESPHREEPPKRGLHGHQ